MTDWQDAVIIMKRNDKKRKSKNRKKDEHSVGLRCWECGLYLDNYNMGHFCTRCFLMKLKKYVTMPKETTNKDNGNSDECNYSDDDNSEDDSED